MKIDVHKIMKGSYYEKISGYNSFGFSMLGIAQRVRDLYARWQFNERFNEQLNECIYKQLNE